MNPKLEHTPSQESPVTSLVLSAQFKKEIGEKLSSVGNLVTQTENSDYQESLETEKDNLVALRQISLCYLLAIALVSEDRNSREEEIKELWAQLQFTYGADKKVLVSDDIKAQSLEELRDEKAQAAVEQLLAGEHYTNISL